MPGDSLAARVWRRPGGAGAAAGGAPTFTAPERHQRSDLLALRPTVRDTEQRSDRLVLPKLALVESVQRGDVVRLPSVALNAPEPRRSDDLARFTAAEEAAPHSATPATDRWGDAWTDSLATNQGVNHGSDATLPIDGALLSATQNDAWMEVDLTRYAGLTAPADGSFTFEVHAVQGLAVAQTFTALFSTFATRPFNETTLTYSNKPADGANQVSKSVSVLVGTVPLNYTISCTPAEYGPFLGKWLMVRFSSTAVLATPITISAREDPTTANRPRLTLVAVR